MKRLLTCIVLFFLAAGCSPRLSPDTGWQNRRWLLIEMSGVPVQLSGTEKDAHLYFQSADQRVSGMGGCNRIGGPYTMDAKGKLSFGQMMSTNMFCPDQGFEDKFLAVLGTVSRYELKNGELLMKKGKEAVLKFR